MDLISNNYDGPKRPKKSEQFNLDFAYSMDAAEIDAGIREAIRGVKVSIMASGIALYRTDVSGLFIDLGFKKFGEYIDSLAEDSGMARTTLYNWEYIGEAYIKHRSELERVGFTNDDGPTKLPFLARALENRPKREVFKAIKDMGKKEFEDWSRGDNVKKVKKYKYVKVKGKHIFVGRSPLVTFADGLSPEDRKYYESLLLEGAKAAKQNQYARCYLFYDADEARRFDRVYQREIRILRGKR